MKINNNLINTIANATEDNNHYLARAIIVKAIAPETNVKAIETTYNFIEKAHSANGYLTEELSALRYNMDKLLKEALFMVVENCDQVWNAL